VNYEVVFGNLAYAAAGMLLMFAGLWIFDRVTPRVNFPDEIAKGNMAVAVIIAAFFLSVAYIIGRSLN
jgi:uncharacterized membrane protein YjfL (UPF0719 family)